MTLKFSPVALYRILCMPEIVFLTACKHISLKNFFSVCVCVWNKQENTHCQERREQPRDQNQGHNLFRMRSCSYHALFFSGLPHDSCCHGLQAPHGKYSRPQSCSIVAVDRLTTTVYCAHAIQSICIGTRWLVIRFVHIVSDNSELKTE